MAFITKKHPGVAADIPPQTRGFVLNHSMLRVKDPAVALDFYTRVMGMRVLRKLDFPEMKFSLYFLAKVEEATQVPDDISERTAWTFG
jgi:lactoylglutathione lyase